MMKNEKKLNKLYGMFFLTLLTSCPAAAMMEGEGAETSDGEQYSQDGTEDGSGFGLRSPARARIDGRPPISEINTTEALPRSALDRQDASGLFFRPRLEASIRLEQLIEQREYYNEELGRISREDSTQANKLAKQRLEKKLLEVERDIKLCDEQPLDVPARSSYVRLLGEDLTGGGAVASPARSFAAVDRALIDGRSAELAQITREFDELAEEKRELENALGQLLSAEQLDESGLAEKKELEHNLQDLEERLQVQQAKLASLDTIESPKRFISTEEEVKSMAQALNELQGQKAAVAQHIKRIQREKEATIKKLAQEKDAKLKEEFNEQLAELEKDVKKRELELDLFEDIENFIQAKAIGKYEEVAGAHQSISQDLADNISAVQQRLSLRMIDAMPSAAPSAGELSSQGSHGPWVNGLIGHTLDKSTGKNIKNNIAGYSLGYQWDCDGSILGVAFSNLYNKGKIANESSNRSIAYLGSLYGAISYGGWFTGASAFLGFGNAKTSRYRGGVNIAKGSIKNTLYGGNLMGGITFGKDEHKFTPYLGLSYAAISQASYKETGPEAMNVGKSLNHALTASFNLKYGYEIVGDDYLITPSVALSASRDLFNKNGNVKISQIGTTGELYNVKGYDGSKTLLGVLPAIEFENSSLKLGLSYGVQFGKKYTAQIGGLRVALKF